MINSAPYHPQKLRKAGGGLVKFHNHMNSILKLALVLGCCHVAGVAAVAQGGGWTLVWADEFSQPDGSTPDTAKWVRETGGGGWGNNEWQTYTTTNATVTNNMLVIEARRIVNGQTTNYTSARLKTQGKAAWTYGRMEARLKIARSQGIWPAFWTLGTGISTVGWPACGEIDIMENIGREPTIVHGTVHGPGYSGGASIGGPYSLPGNPAFADDFHVYAVEWTTNLIKWFVDGQQYFSVTPASLPGAWVFAQPQFILLNVAVGGNWPGYPDSTTVFPQRMLVDYVRVYSGGASNPPPTNSGVLINGSFETGSLSPWLGKGFCCANPAGGNIMDTNGLVWDPNLNGNNNQDIKNPAVGTYSCKVYGNFSGSPNNPGFYQDVAALPGSLWTATIKARTQNTDYIRHSNQAVAEVTFLDSVDNPLAKYTSAVFNTNTPINTWISLDITNRTLPTVGTTNRMRAPPGTYKARFEVTYSQLLYEVGSIYFDEAKWEEIPVARPALAATLNGLGNLQLSFATQSGVNYQVLGKSALGDPAWAPLDSFSGDGLTKTLSYPANSPARFFSVQAW